MARVSLASILVALVSSVGACQETTPAPEAAKPPPRVARPRPRIARSPGETHLAEIEQLTLNGENAEAYFSFSGRELVLQARTGDTDCDRIYRMPAAGAELPAMTPVSSGKGVTTCSYFMPGDREVIYASTHLAGDACPLKPDRSQGYVWALYDSYDIFKANADGTNVRRLTDTKGYDAEATVCAKDGSIVFTSVRDGDIDLYRMDANGQNVKRLTNTPGYDGGAFFNADCSKIVWRASRPRPGKELDDFRALLAQNLVRPSKLELYVANADGSEATQITYLDAASFAPFFHPSGKRVVFSSNYGDPKGREFDLFAVDTDGKNLERITTARGFDGFPMFAPDGKTLVFASNRATAPGHHDTNVFLARWMDGPIARVAETPADRIATDVTWLADPAREGRGIGTKGLDDAGAYLEERMKALHLEPAGDGATFRQAFPVPTSLTLAPGSQVVLDGAKIAPGSDFTVMGFSPAKASAKGELAFAEYGMAAKELDVDDYARVSVKGKIAVVRRFTPDDPTKFKSGEAQRRHGDIRVKAWLAKEHGAKALIVVDDPAKPASAPADWKAPDEAKLPPLRQEGAGYGDAGIPVIVVKRAIGQPLIQKLLAKKSARAELTIELHTTTKDAFNVVGRIAAAPSDGKKLPGVVVVGAHYDHLGRGGHHSLAPGSDAPHVGADDNASGTAALLEVARQLSDNRAALQRDVIIAAFSGEESGVLGSAHYTRVADAAGAKKPKRKPGEPSETFFAMLNMDMVGRLRENRLQVLGTDTAGEWEDLLRPACDAARVDCVAAPGGGYGPSDQMPFYVAGAPVLHFFTGTHSDYHKPSDTSDKINAVGAGQTARIVAQLAASLGARDARLSYKSDAKGPPPAGDARSFNASLGTIPDYAGPGPGKKGVLLSGVRPGGGADQGGLKRGDIIIRIGPHEVASVEDLMFVLNSSKPGETAPVVVVRDGKEVRLQVTFQESRR